MLKGDLHIHTSASDGILSPVGVARAALASDMDFFSVADHNCLYALRQIEIIMPRDGPVFIFGVELSAQPEEGDEIHLLGYGFEPDDPTLREVCRKITRRKKRQIRQMVECLRGYGVDIGEDALALEDDDSYVGRPALAERLVAKGVVSTLNQAFSQYLARGARAFVQMPNFSPQRCLGAIHAAGGLAVLAHPTIQTIDRWIKPLADAGLDGVEASRPRRVGNEQLYVEKAAEHFGLFVTGGSDFHGRDNERPLGTFAVGADYLGGFFAALRTTPGRDAAWLADGAPKDSGPTDPPRPG